MSSYQQCLKLATACRLAWMLLCKPIFVFARGSSKKWLYFDSVAHDLLPVCLAFTPGQPNCSTVRLHEVRARFCKILHQHSPTLHASPYRGSLGCIVTTSSTWDAVEELLHPWPITRLYRAGPPP